MKTTRRRKIARNSILVSLCISLYFGFIFHREIFFSFDHEFTVTKMDIAEVCVSHSTIFKRKFSSSAPEMKYLGPCGAVHTTAGTYELIDSFKWLRVDPSREDMLAVLREGCRYRVRIAGGHPKVEEGGRPYGRLVHRIRYVKEVLGCNDSPQAYRAAPDLGWG